jgi:AcrR family transcriptional regulator
MTTVGQAHEGGLTKSVEMELLTGDPRPSAPRRTTLVATAARLFQAHGYHAVGMRMIAEAEGIRAPSVYNHFASKEDLLLEAIFSVNRDFIRHALPLLEEPGTYAERLRKLVTAQVRHMVEHRDAWWLHRRELRALSPENLERVQRDRRYYQRRLSNFIAAGVEAGEFTCPSPQLATLALLDMINGVNEWYTPEGTYSLEALADEYAAMVINGLLQTTPWRPPCSTPPQ